jgi:pyrimidine-nucleoside phosphorylase
VAHRRDGSLGQGVDLSSIPGTKVDKHSTGGVADTTTLVLAPLVAACGVPIAKMSGGDSVTPAARSTSSSRFPGMRIELSRRGLPRAGRRVGVAVIAQSPDIDPADKKMYALRDVTATVPSIPLIVGSIISKKVAGGADAILLGREGRIGCVHEDREQARAFAGELTRVGAALGKDVHCVMSDMDQPLGWRWATRSRS